jgi:P4 family phage/plasmid primase-like protien
MEEHHSSLNTNENVKNTAIKYRDVFDFLSKHIHQKNPHSTNPKSVTNTRIGDPKQNIHGGSYHIDDSEYETFLKLYAEDVIVKKKKEYMTEMQLENVGPILVDLDFRYDYEIDEKQHNYEEIVELIGGYLDVFKSIFQLDDSVQFPIFVFEKPTVNRIDDKTKNKKLTKDGIHMIIGLQSDHIVQLMLREQVIEKAAEIWKNLPLKNSWEDVFDKGISTGKTPWQLYGSRKPGNERYQLTHVFDVKWSEDDSEFLYPEIPLSNFDVVKNIAKLSVRYKNHLSLFMKNNFIQEYEKYKVENRLGGPTDTSNSQTLTTIARNAHLDIYNDDFLNPNNIAKIRSKQELDKYVNNFLDSIQISDYNLRETHEYAMILPPSYYGASSYDKWIRVGWVLRNTDNRLLITWIAFSAKSPTFHYASDVPDLCERWRNFDLRKHNGLSRRSLINWAKTDVYDAYEGVRNKTIDYFLEQTIRINNLTTSKVDDRAGCGDTDIAKVLYEVYKHRFVCVGIKGNDWFEYKNHRWHKVDSGTTLRRAISEQLRDLYNQKSSGSMDVMIVNGESKENLDELNKRRSMRILNISSRLSDSNGKDRIMKEAKELFYDDSFLNKMDTNPYLLCFKNGVFDFKEKVFRKGHPEDNITMCTNIEYIPLDKSKHKKLVDEINDFMDKLFPEKQLCEYMWDHLASTLIGTSTNQTFNMYIGGGQNGKSVLVNLMEMCLGDYKGDVPLTLVTEKRGKVGGLTPEIVELKGIRYAVMQEPSKGDKINEGIMKALTSGKDRLQGRAPYMPQTITFLPQFKLVVTCNVFMEIKSNDHGTWRRIRAVPFKSLFTKTPVNGDKEKPFQFLLDEYIDEKFDSWKEVFCAMLVDRAVRTNGMVKDCSIVMAKSNEYRQSQDYISEFVTDRIIKDEHGKIKKMELNSEFTIWHGANYGGRAPGPKDLHEYMDKEFGRQKNQCWMGVKIKYDNFDDNDYNNYVVEEEEESDEIKEEDL